ncbi:hypothetical protein AX17_005606 [Amanita inopinata Kibby_2008]|nr:hypothetical protein AX17_005606 [Amanita inopinata Kibby_2008]
MSQAPRGLSTEEKRIRLLEIFHETKDFFQLKELERLGPKMKGIVSQSVKEVLQSLADDGLVQTDKIGSSNFFWSFPSQQGAMAQRRLITVNDTRKNHQTQVSELKAMVEIERSARVESGRRVGCFERLANLKGQLNELERELLAYGDCDPLRFEETRRAIVIAKEAASRWTDNYGTLLGYFTRQKGVDVVEIRKYLGIEEDYEDVF